MKRIPTVFFLIGCLIGLAASTRADQPAVGFWLVEVSKLAEATGDGEETLAAVQQHVLDEVAECRGHFNGDCDLWMRTEAVQFRLKAKDDGKVLGYSISLSGPRDRSVPRVSEGSLAVDGGFCVQEGWRKKTFVVVFRRLNLKH